MIRSKIGIFTFIFFSILSSSLFPYDKDLLDELRQMLKLKGEKLNETLTTFYWNYSSDEYTQIFTTKPYTLSDSLHIYWSVFNKLINLKFENSLDETCRDHVVELVINEMLQHSGKTEYPKLLESYKNLNTNSFFKSSTFIKILCDYKIKNEINEIIKQKCTSNDRVSYPENLVTPFSLFQLQDDLKNCWRLYKSLQNYYENRISQDSLHEWSSVQENYDDFDKKIEEILLDNSHNENDLKDILMYTWGSWCGTGSEYFEEKRQIAILMILLKEKNCKAVIGNLNFLSNIHSKQYVSLIQHCNINWIDYSTGVILDGRWYDVPSEFFETGGNEAAVNLVRMKNYNYKSEFEKFCYLLACYNFISKKRLNLDFIDTNWKHYIPIKEYNKIDITPEVKKDLESTIINIIKNDTTLNINCLAIKMLNNFQFSEEIKEILIKYSDSGFKEVREKAIILLKKNKIRI